MASAVRLLDCTRACSHVQLSSPLTAHRSVVLIFSDRKNGKGFTRQSELSGSQQKLTPLAKSSQQNDGLLSSDGDEDGVSLGTLKLPGNTDLQRFESLLFQARMKTISLTDQNSRLFFAFTDGNNRQMTAQMWANSLCQGANLPLAVPLKVDKIPGGVRLGFITVGDGKTEVLVYIDCMVFPATSGSGPIFRAIRNGPLKDKSPPGEPRIMRSLLEALKKSVEIARV